MNQFKKIIISFAALSAIFTSAAQANSFGIRVNPLTLLIGFVDASIDIKLTDSIMITPQVQSMSLTVGDFSWKASGYGLSADYHFSGAFNDSFYFGALYRSLTMTVEDTSSKGEATVTLTGGQLGYMWVWDSFYMNLAFYGGATSDAKISAKDKTTNLETSEESVPSVAAGGGLDFKLGWSF